MPSERFAFKIIVQIKLEGFLLPPSWSKKSLLISVTLGFAVVRSDFFAVWIDYHGWFVAVIWTDVNDALDNEENVRRKLVCRPKLIIFLDDDFGTQSIRALEKNHMERREKGQLCGVNRNQSSLHARMPAAVGRLRQGVLGFLNEIMLLQHPRTWKISSC